MVETTILKQKVKTERVSELKDWMEDVESRKPEVIETLQDEGVRTESAFLEESPEGTFLVTYMEAADLQDVQETFEDSTHEIDVEYKQVVRECLVDDRPVRSFELLYHVINPDR